ncbi:MAG TPA: hypothetical protein DEH78_30325, partial [Solibacterales bacterium]|nr:hypothetical protein [Bryobacterales bacterium]
MRFGSPPFCSKEHRAAYHERQEQLALTSLMRTRPARPASETALPNLDELAAAALSAPAAPAAPPAPVAVAQAEPDPPSPAEYLAYGPDFAPPASGVLAPDLDPAEAPVRDLLQLARHTGASGGERDLGFASLVDLEELGAPCGGGSRARAPEGLGERLGAPGPAAAGPSLTPAFETDLAMARLARLSAGEAQGDPVGAPWTGIENHHAPLADGPGRCAMPAAPCGLGERWIPEGACAPLGEPAATPLPVPAPQIGAPWEAVVPESPRKPAGSALFWCASGFPSLASAVAPQGVLAKATPAQPYARPSLAAALGAGALATAKPSQLDGSENWVWAGLAGLTLEPNRAAASPVRVGLSRAAVEPGLSKPGRAEGLRAGLAGASLLNVEFSPGAGFAPAAGVVAGSEDRLNASCATAALTAAASGLRPLETAVEPADEWASLAAPEAEEGTAGLRRVLVALAEEPLRGPSIAGRALAGGERLPAQAAAVSFEAPHGAVEDHPYRMRSEER